MVTTQKGSQGFLTTQKGSQGFLILGLDPGTATTGFGLLYKNGKGLEVLDWGIIETNKKNNKGHRLNSIYKETLALFKKHSPDVMAMESIFFANNAKTAIAVGQAQGVMLLAASKSKVTVVEYAPGSIKKVVSGNGRSDKKMMQTAVRKILGAKVRSAKHKKTHFDNAADALAVALCHAITSSGKDDISVSETVMKGGEVNV